MDEFERRLRDHVRATVEVVEPVSMDDVRARAAAPDAQPAATSGPSRRRSELVAVAACTVMALGLGFVAGRWSAGDVTDERAPAESAPVDPFVTLPEPSPTVPPDPIDDVMETSIGSISWSRVEGASSAMPQRVVGRDGTTLIGEDSDPSVVWSSTDGGSTWERSVGEGVRGEAGGHEWVHRSGPDGARLSRVTADGEVDVEVGGAVGDVPDGWNTFVDRPDLPIDLGGEAFLLTNTSVRINIGAVASELGGRIVGMMGDDSSMTYTVVSEDLDGSRSDGLLLTLTARPDSRGVDVTDPDGAVVATFDADIAPFDDIDPTALAMFGGSASQWAVFDGDRFEPLEVPWPDSAHADLFGVGDSIMVVAQHSPPMGAPDGGEVSVWTTTDGRIWADVTSGLPDDGFTSASAFATDGAVVLEMWGDPGGRRSWFLTRDGRTFEPLSSTPPTNQRHQTDVGWVAMPHGAFTLWVSPDGEDWESHRLAGLHGLGYAGYGAYGEISMVDSTIHIVVRHNDLDRAVLLIGEITPAT